MQDFGRADFVYWSMVQRFRQRMDVLNLFAHRGIGQFAIVVLLDILFSDE